MQVLQGLVKHVVHSQKCSALRAGAAIVGVFRHWPSVQLHRDHGYSGALDASKLAVLLQLLPSSRLTLLSHSKLSFAIWKKRILVLTTLPAGSLPIALISISPSFQWPNHSAFTAGCSA